MRHSRYQGLWINLRESLTVARVMRTRQGLSIAVLGALLLSLVAVIVVKPLEAKQGQSSAPLASKALFFASDGMRPDLMEKYAADGAMPTYKKLMKNGVRGDNGMLRRSRRTPASAGTRWRPARSRPSTARRTTRTSGRRRVLQPDVVLGREHDAGGHDRQRRRARRQEGRPDRLGRRRCRRHQRADRRLHELLLEPRRARGAGQRDRAGGRGRLRRHLPGRGASAPRRLDERPGWRPGRAPKQTTLRDPTTFAAPEPEPHLQPLLLRQHGQRRRSLRPRDPSARRARTAARRRRSTLTVGDFQPVKLDGRERPDRRARPARRPASTSS